MPPSAKNHQPKNGEGDLAGRRNPSKSQVLRILEDPHSLPLGAQSFDPFNTVPPRLKEQSHALIFFRKSQYEPTCSSISQLFKPACPSSQVLGVDHYMPCNADQYYYSPDHQVFRHTYTALQPRNQWLPSAFQDPVLMQATLFVAAMARSVIHGKPLKSDTLY
jgi:hypothetical protein